MWENRGEKLSLICIERDRGRQVKTESQRLFDKNIVDSEIILFNKFI